MCCCVLLCSAVFCCVLVCCGDAFSPASLASLSLSAWKVLPFSGTWPWPPRRTCPALTQLSKPQPTCSPERGGRMRKCLLRASNPRRKSSSAGGASRRYPSRTCCRGSGPTCATASRATQPTQPSPVTGSMLTKKFRKKQHGSSFVTAAWLASTEGAWPTRSCAV